MQDDKKGQFYLAVIRRPGRAATDIIAEVVPDTIRKFPWPKSMRWGSGPMSAAPEGTARWERIQEVVKTIAVWIPATKRALSDAGVKEGDLLFTLDARQLRAQSEQITAQIAKDMAQIEQAVLAGLPGGTVLGDTVYGTDLSLRRGVTALGTGATTGAARRRRATCAAAGGPSRWARAAHRATTTTAASPSSRWATPAAAFCRGGCLTRSAA